MAPVAFGTVDLPVIGAMEIIIAFATFIWMARSVLGGKITFAKTPLNIPILAFIILIIAQYSIGTLSSSRAGTVYPYATKLSLLEASSYMMAFLVIMNNFHSRRKINRLLAVIISTGTLLAIYGIIQRLTGAQKIFWIRQVHEVLLFYSTYINCNYFAGYMDMVIFVGLGAFFAYLGHLDRKKGYGRFDLFEGWNLLFIFSLAMMASSVFHTLSLGAIIVFFSTLAFFYFTYSKRRSAPAWAIAVILALLVASALAMSIWISRVTITGIIAEVIRLFREINRYGMRIPILVRASAMLKINPVFGTGLGTFRYIFPAYKPNAGISFAHCHNDYLELAIETGIAGFTIFCIGMSRLFLAYIKLLRSRHDPYVKAIGYGCLASAFSIFAYSFIDSNMHIGANALLFTVILAAGSVILHSKVKNDSEETIFKERVFLIPTRRKQVTLAAILSLILLAFVSEVLSISTAHLYASFGKKGRDATYARKAVRLEPGSSEYHYLLAELLSKGYLNIDIRNEALVREVTGELQEAIRLNPSVSAYHRRLGFIYSRMGEDSKAVTHLKRAAGLDPYYAFNHLLLAIHYFNKATALKGIGLYGSEAMEEGVSEYRKSLSTDPNLTLDRFSRLLGNYHIIKAALKRYSL